MLLPCSGKGTRREVWKQEVKGPSKREIEIVRGGGKKTNEPPSERELALYLLYSQQGLAINIS